MNKQKINKQVWYSILRKQFTTLCFSTSYLPRVGNESEISHVYRRYLNSMLKNIVRWITKSVSNLKGIRFTAVCLAEAKHQSVYKACLLSNVFTFMFIYFNVML